MSSLKLLSIVLLANMQLPAAATAAAVDNPSPDPSQGDGGVSRFYAWTPAVPPHAGVILRTEPLESKLVLANAGVGIRILYSSRNGLDDHTPIAVSGALFLPKGRAPKGGWPVVAWAHGTVGVADICAPSWSGRSDRDIEYLNKWLASGFAIVATDYQGLGTPGGHPYLATRPAAYGVLDSVRAALGLRPDLANSVVLVGQSQGAAGVIEAAARAPGYAPELHVRGVVATGAPYLVAPPPGTAQPPRPQPLSTEVSPTLAYRLLMVYLAQQLDSSLRPDAYITDEALPAYRLGATSCLHTVEDYVVDQKLSPAVSLRPTFTAVRDKVMPYMEYSTLSIRPPLFVGTGERDRDVPPAMQRQLIAELCRAGTTVVTRSYQGLNHSGTVNASAEDSIPFAVAVSKGGPVASSC